jgi:Flp pilus assembly pilin Flp
MRQTVKVRTSEGHNLHIALEHWGSGLDHTLRRWILNDGYWECMDTGELAEESGLSRLKILNAWKPGGQTMVEYALIIAALAVVAWGAYNLTGHDIGSMASGIDSALTSA